MSTMLQNFVSYVCFQKSDTFWKQLFSEVLYMSLLQVRPDIAYKALEVVLVSPVLQYILCTDNYTIVSDPVSLF